MSRKPENQFVTGVHEYLPPVTELYRAKMQNPFTAGIWDWWYSGREADLWVEYKFSTLPKRPDTLFVPNLSPLQRAWGQGRTKEGRELLVVQGFRDGGVLYTKDRPHWEDELSAKELKHLMRSRKEIAQYIVEVTM